MRRLMILTSGRPGTTRPKSSTNSVGLCRMFAKFTYWPSAVASSIVTLTETGFESLMGSPPRRFYGAGSVKEFSAAEPRRPKEANLRRRMLTRTVLAAAGLTIAVAEMGSGRTPPQQEMPVPAERLLSEADAHYARRSEGHVGPRAAS